MKKRIWLRCALPLLLLAVGAAVLWPCRRLLTAEAISQRSPGSAAAAALFLLALYAVKGLSVCFPLSALVAAGGLLFPYPVALGVNLVGVAIVHTLPFLLGRRSQEGLDALTARYPKLSVLQDLHWGSDGLLVFLLRLSGASPGDLVSLYLGAAGVPFFRYLAAGLAGAAPRVAATTFLGTALWDPWSEQFWLSVAINAAVTVFSVALWRLRRLHAPPGTSPQE